VPSFFIDGKNGKNSVGKVVGYLRRAGKREPFGDPKKSGHPDVNRAETDGL
jgi:hypothetical protein